MTRVFSIVAACCGVLMTLAGTPKAHAAMLTNGGNFPYGGQVCAEAGGLTFAPGTAALINPCHGYTNQQWNIELGRIFSYGLSKTHNVCLDVANGATAAGSPVIISACGNGTAAASQFWSVSNGQIINTQSGLCLDGTTQVQGTQLEINPCAGTGLTQQWEIK